MSKVKKVLRTIIAEEVAKEVRKVIKENQEAQQGQQEVGAARETIDRVLTQAEVMNFKQHATNLNNLVGLLRELLDRVADELKIDDKNMVKALTLLLKQVKEAAQQKKLKGDEAAKEAM